MSEQEYRRLDARLSHAGHTCWSSLLPLVLEDAIVHLQMVVFDTPDAWGRSEAVTHEDALRRRLAEYETGLALIFGFVRRAGLVGDGVAWSAFKADMRRAGRDANEELSLRTARDEALYQVERHVPPADPNLAAAWSAGLREFLAWWIGRAPAAPRPEEDDSRLAWAYGRIADLEDHTRFHDELLRFLEQRRSRDPDCGDGVIMLQNTLFNQPRFDLVQNLALRWVAQCA